MYKTLFRRATNFAVLTPYFLAICIAVGCGPAASPQVSEKPKPKKEKPPAEPEFVPPTINSVDEAISIMRESANKNDQRVRIVAQQYLVKQGEAIIEPMGKLVVDQNEQLATRVVACRVLGQLGQPAKPKLKAGLDADQKLVRLNSLEQLSVLEPTSADIVDILIAHLDDEDMQTQRVALDGLAYIGEPAAKAKDKLLALLNDTTENETIRGGASKALKSVNPRTSFQD